MVRTSTGAGKNTEKSDGPVRHLTCRPNGLVAENRRVTVRVPGDRSLPLRLSALPDETVEREPAWVARTLFAWRALRPLVWFGLVECREDGGDLENASWYESCQ